MDTRTWCGLICWLCLFVTIKCATENLGTMRIYDAMQSQRVKATKVSDSVKFKNNKKPLALSTGNRGFKRTVTLDDFYFCTEFWLVSFSFITIYYS